MLRSAFPTCTAKHKNYTGRHSLCLQSDSRFVRLLNSGRPPPRARPLRGSGARGATSIAEEPMEHERPDVCYNVEDIPIGAREVLRDQLAAACAHELHMTQEEWNMVTTYMSTIDNKPRKRPHSRSNKHKSPIGESRASDSYGHNADVDDTVLDALITQYMVVDHAPEVIMITEQVNADGLVIKIEEQKLADLKQVNPRGLRNGDGGFFPDPP